MIKKITTKSRREVEWAINSSTKLSKHPWALISIWSAEELITPFNRETLSKIGCTEVLSVRFSDLTLDEYNKLTVQKAGAFLFGEEQAKNIVRFIDKVNIMEIPEVFVHCAAGISRSGAVGTWACRYLNLDEKKFLENNKHILPNIYILGVLNSVSGINDEYMKFWETELNKEKRVRMMTNLF
jgi:protein-tyrosine phosphatase